MEYMIENIFNKNLVDLYYVYLNLKLIYLFNINHSYNIHIIILFGSEKKYRSCKDNIDVIV